MITLERDTLVFRFPDVHKKATTYIEFQRTLRIPDDGREYPLPPGLGCFPLRHTEDLDGSSASNWADRGGVAMPIHATEAMWIKFRRDEKAFPFAIKIAAGKINAVSGKSWSQELRTGENDYVVVPRQPWLDGFCTAQDQIRQFVAMRLGAGYSVEEQITGRAEWGGLQIVAYPMKAGRYAALVAERHAAELRRQEEEQRRKAEQRAAEMQRRAYIEAAFRERLAWRIKRYGEARAHELEAEDLKRYEASQVRANFSHGAKLYCIERSKRRSSLPEAPKSMALGAGGRMRQQIYADPYGVSIR